MEKRRAIIPLVKPVSVQARLALSMVYQVKHKMKISKWMQAKDIVEANPMIFDRIRKAVERDYGFDFTISHSWKAAEMLLEGMKYDID